MSEPMEILKQSAVFEDLSSEALTRLLSLSRTRRYAAGDILFVELSEGDDLFFVLDGKLSVQLALGNADKPYEIFSVGAGDLVGEISLVERGLRSATVTAETSATVLVWDCAALREECRRDPELGYGLILGVAKVLARRIRHWNAWLLEHALWGLP